MASVWKHPKSQFYVACFTSSDGRQLKRSTKETDRKTALKIAEKYEDAARKQTTEAQARRVINDIYEIIHGERLLTSNVRDYFNTWLERKKVETKPNTFKKYESVAKQFTTFLEEKTEKDLTFITSRDIASFRDQLAKRLSATTANLAVKILRVAFEQAFRDGLIQFSPAKQVTTISRKGEKSIRRGFKLAELKNILKAASDEWRGMILTGLYTGGQRLKDVATLTWQNIDDDEIQFVMHKTGRRQRIPIAKPLQTYIESLTVTDDPHQPLFPKAFAWVEKTGDVRRLSAEFYEILVSAGLAHARSKANTGRGQSVKRQSNELSFHSLRHTATSLMKNAGISPAIVQDIVGHESTAVSTHYTKIEEDVKREAINTLPDFVGLKSKSKKPKARKSKKQKV